MEIIDKNKIGKKERFYIEANEMVEDLIQQKQEKILKRFIPNEDDLEYLKTFRKGLYNKEGKSKGGTFAVVASFPMEVNIFMTNLHGNGWVDKPGVLQEFLQKNPHYRVGSPMTGLQGGIGLIQAGGANDASI